MTKRVLKDEEHVITFRVGEALDALNRLKEKTGKSQSELFREGLIRLERGDHTLSEKTLGKLEALAQLTDQSVNQVVDQLVSIHASATLLAKKVDEPTSRLAGVVEALRRLDKDSRDEG